MRGWCTAGGLAHCWDGKDVQPERIWRECHSERAGV